MGSRRLRTLVRFVIAVGIGAGATLAWQAYGDEAKQIVRTRVPSLAWLIPASTAKSPAGADIAGEQAALGRDGQVPAQPEALAAGAASPAPAADAISTKLEPQLEALARDLAVVRSSVEQLTLQQDKMAESLATMQAVQRDIKEKVLAPPPSPASHAATTPPPPRKDAAKTAPPPRRPVPPQ
jgi:hypothetical protein